MAGLFGRGNAQPGPRVGLMERIGMAGVSLQGGAPMQDQLRAREQAMQAQQALAQRTMQEDRLRAALSPADNEMGSGMGAAPSLQQQMAALDEARLLNPEVADQFAPYVQNQQSRQQAETLFKNDPRGQALWASGLPEFRKAVAEQYSPQVIASGGIQSIAGEGRTIGAPVFRDFGPTIQKLDPITGQATTIASRTPDPVNVAPGGRLLNPETGGLVGQGADRVFAAGQGVTLFNEGGGEVASNPKDTADPNAYMRTEQSRAAIANTRRAVTDAMDQVGALSTGFLAGLIPGNQWKADLEATADTIEANLSFTALQQMRDASKTGGALGGIAIRELELLGSTIASLKTSQSPDQFRRSLGVINAALERWENALGEQPQSGAASGPIAVNPQTGQRVQWNGSAWVAIP